MKWIARVIRCVGLFAACVGGAGCEKRTGTGGGYYPSYSPVEATYRPTSPSYSPPQFFAPASPQAPKYLGELSSNPFRFRSVGNPYGSGSPYHPDSINNPYGLYGSPYSPHSATNPREPQTCSPPCPTRCRR